MATFNHLLTDVNTRAGLIHFDVKHFKYKFVSNISLLVQSIIKKYETNITEKLVSFGKFISHIYETIFYYYGF